jgi:hypothetical protein
LPLAPRRERARADSECDSADRAYQESFASARARDGRRGEQQSRRKPQAGATDRRQKGDQKSAFIPRWRAGDINGFDC